MKGTHAPLTTCEGDTTGGPAAVTADASAVRAGFELDHASLAAWLASHLPAFTHLSEIEQFSGGQSNPTYRLTTPAGRYVLRRKPGGSLLPGAHAIEREVRVMEALGSRGFPVPRVLASCGDTSVIGSAFYVMECIEGRIFRDGGLPELSRAERAAYYEAMAATLGALHSLDPAQCGLGDFGRPDRYMERHLARWIQQYEQETAAPRNPDMDFLAAWLLRHLPAERPARVVHGDYRIDNIVFHPSQPKVIAVLDWELSTLGDPIADFAYNLTMYKTPSSLPWGLADRDLEVLGLLDEDDYIATYCRCAGIEKPFELNVYLAYSFFRIAAIIHGIHGRMIRGNATSANASNLVSNLGAVARNGRSVAEAAAAVLSN